MAPPVFFWFLMLQLDRVRSSAPLVFVQKDKDVLLEVDNVPQQFIVFLWKFEKNGLILVSYSSDNKPTIHENYTGRIDFHETNKHSVILKNLQETDSGVYTGQLTTGNGQFPLVRHHIIVQDVVSPVKLEVSSVSDSSHSCNVTLTCSARDSGINSTIRCVNQACDQDGGIQSMITESNSSLKVYLKNDVVICNHSNQVNSTEDEINIPHLCTRYTANRTNRNHIVGYAVGAGVCLLVSITALYMWTHRKKKHNMTTDSTIYTLPTVASSTFVAEASSGGGGENSGETIYSLVKPHGATSESAGTANKPLPDSLYAQIEKHPVA